MAKILGIDTSNYTTSAALLDTDSMSFVQQKLLLPVKSGEKGIRQSDAVFHHTKQLPQMIEKVSAGIIPDGIGVSVKPRLADGSYMPCFLVGEAAADMIGSVCGVTVDKTSHQIGHILAALYSSGRLCYARGDRPFASFHVSGGTTDLLLCRPDKDKLLEIERIGGSNDLKAGQAIDRCGVMLGLSFPCGQELERLAIKCSRDFRIKPRVKEHECSLSGLENQFIKMKNDGCSDEEIAGFCIQSVLEAVRALTEDLYDSFGKMPVIYAGGVMSNRMIRDALESDERVFCEPELSRDNAVGVAVYSALVKGLIG